MSSGRALPPLLQPYLALPVESSLILLTSVLGASTNWLVLRYLAAYLTEGRLEDTEGDGNGAVKVVFVSFLRDWEFWREGGKRLGLDLEKLAARKDLVFLDGLSGLFTGFVRKDNNRRGHGVGTTVLTDAGLDGVRDAIVSAAQGLKTSSGLQEDCKIVLVVDNLDFLLAASGGETTTWDAQNTLLGLREQFHSVVLTLSADLPLIAERETTLETQHAAFVTSLAHQASLVVGLRCLDSGVAGDVSGVMGITHGGAGEDVWNRRDLESSPGRDANVERYEERELLYCIAGDGSVKVFERGQ